ncbi:Uma2 family endonuclease [Rubrivirga sp. IMCC45206]|uniref:Uma2 family endonuclease n=1 Tax=Rubrivirga sp. IMCC45206 TaxID=3391614 RepID=UPI0039900C4E
MPTTLPDIPLRVEEWTSYPGSFDAFMALPEGTLAQYIDGTIHMSPAPRPQHQNVVLKLGAALQAYAAEHGGYAAIAPFDVYLESDRAVQPDVFYLAADRLDRISERGIEGAPTLVVEVLSPSTAYLDVLVKRRLYEEADVDEYWVIDPGERSVMVLTREHPGLAGLARTAYVYEAGPVASTALAGFEVEAANLFDRP